ncbi:C40 family peptidase [Streptomyces sp. Ac-502]|uniref:C40 family peptidase n=1 Tax=Streptomyces sp. Ac-502 TaxID=3342801 RepID=UPI0038627FB7
MSIAVGAAASPVGRRLAVSAAALAALGCAAVLSLGSLAMTPTATAMTGVSCPVDGVAVGDGDGSTGLSAEQIKNAQAIIAAGQQMQIPVRGQIVAITAALQESGLRNLDHGDRDSIGLFQMRPSQGWGTREQILNPAWAARKFYSMLLKVPGWQGMTVNDAAQAVERSGYPDAYGKHERKAVQIVTAIGGSTAGVTPADTAGCTPVIDTPTGATGTALKSMLDQVGKPYVWGATGPDAFDCSGLIVWGWRQAGYELSVRTSQQMYNVATPVPAGQEKPGDLIFTEMDKQAGVAGPAHVLVVVRPGLAVEAPRTGVPVRTRKYDAAKEHMRFGRLPKSALTPKSAA